VQAHILATMVTLWLLWYFCHCHFLSHTSCVRHTGTPDRKKLKSYDYGMAFYSITPL